jgi:heme exporter protein A
MSIYEIQIENLNKSFGRHLVLKDINLAVKKGGFLTIFGPNGAGKTTLIKILSTLVAPTEGKITISDIVLSDDPTDIRKKIGLISHNALLYLDLSAYENLEFYGTLYGVENLKERAEALLDQVELTHRRHDQVRTFSKGMQQRLAIARSLIHQPSIMFLDEPHSGLDPHAVDILDSLIDSIRDDHTFVMVTHDLAKGLDLCSSAIIMDGGDIIFHSDRNGIDESEFRDIYRRVVRGEG